MIKKFWNWLNKPRCLEIIYESDDDKPMFELDPTEKIDKNKLENVKITIEFNKVLRQLRSNNFDNTYHILKDIIKKQNIKDGLLITNKQLKEDTEKTIVYYAQIGLIDDLNNLTEEAMELLEIEA